jgi:rhamnose transport system permease protein
MRGRFFREWPVVLALGVVLVLLGVRAPSFFIWENIRSLLVSAAPLLVAAVGMTLVILTRNIDISIGSQLSICGVVAGLLARAGVPIGIVVVAAIACGAFMGAVNGALVTGLGLPSIVVTLAGMVSLRQALGWYQEGKLVRGLSVDFQWFGMEQREGSWLILGLAATVVLVFAFGLRFVAAGRAIYATGSDPEAARLAGIRPRAVVFAVFVTMGTLTGLAALLNAVPLPYIDPMAGNGFELKVIAPVVLGGVAISGGRGSLVGVLFGVALLGTMGRALVFLGTEAHWEKVVQGSIILLAVALDALNNRKRQR